MDAVLYKWFGIAGIGVAVFLASYHYNRKFLDWLRFQSLGTRDYISEKLQLMFLDIPPHKILLGQFALSAGAGVLVFLSFLPQLFPAIFFGILATIVGWKAPKPIIDYLYYRRVNQFVNQMIDGLGLMSNGMKSGLSITQSMGLVVKEMPNPIKEEFNYILNQNRLGVSLEECFTNLSKRVASDDVEMFVTSINILSETGGNLAETFDTIVVTMRERIKVENKIQALTAQGRNQGFFLLMVPPVMFFMFQQLDPEFMKPVTETFIGWIVLFIVFVLMLIALVAILRVTKIDV